MRKPNQLFKNNEKVWLYFATDESGKHFYECASDMNLHFAKGTEVKENDTGTLMSLTKEGEMAYISPMAWNYGFTNSSDSISENQKTFVNHLNINFDKLDYPKIDFDKFVSGSGDYILRESPIRPATEEEISKYNENNG